ncbi:zinc-binding metallopeptidase family protein [Limnoglobus roseus]|uniref:Zinc-ribbon domain-containing protein n=1 Tax=Limnoglobus roseus TaxID=2598579 RepID=A0A5C1AEU4_9BACT|nr:putative zinc-binding peptidase [Limnoglobus roseus]QEL17939.1 hypothetical protein PX52LOC_04953 [Limnoglobus roseus]
MKIFHCDHCDHVAFFENVQCVKCGHTLAYLPDLGVVGSLDLDPETKTWKSPLQRAAGKEYRLCRNYTDQNVCNWAVPADSKQEFCQSCQLTRAIPDLSRVERHQAWYKLEVAKRRLVYTILGLELTTDGLVFEFLADPDDPEAPRVLTGHADGLITVNIDEADDVVREQRRTQMREPYRTLLGHMRHESGHFYFDKLIAPNPEQLERFRGVFGDERADYGEAVKKHYDTGAPANWPDNFVSAYATMHPWEDWAETWAHYLHMVDALETASACGLSLQPRRKDEPSVKKVPDPVKEESTKFAKMMDGWFPLTYALNNLNRGLGLADAYPFVLSTPAVNKLRFIHEVTTTSLPAPRE